MPQPHQDRKALIGFADPVLGAARVAAREARPMQTASLRRTQAYSTYWKGALVDVQALGAGLDPLPETADELRAVAKAIGGAAEDIHLGASATETAVKDKKLSDYRVIYFATHGLVAGELKGLAEPALVLSVPQTGTSRDDGLLTASEVAQLKLDADWVVLSACNTAAANKAGAEAFSGLARAFFYAGARSLLVSHWPVEFALRGSPDHGVVRALEGGSARWAGRGLARIDARTHERPLGCAQRASSLLGTVHGGRRKRVVVCLALSSGIGSKLH